MSFPKDGALTQAFFSSFSFQWVNSEQHRRRWYRLRHRVYCEQRGFEPPRVERQESDMDDQHAQAMLLQTNDGQEIGGFRLLQSSASIRLPCEQLDMPHLVPPQSAELSRFLLSSRAGERTLINSERQVASRGLYMLALACLIRMGVEQAYGIVPAGQERILARLGFRTQRLGVLFEHHGPRRLIHFVPQRQVATILPAYQHLLATCIDSLQLEATA